MIVSLQCCDELSILDNNHVEKNIIGSMDLCVLFVIAAYIQKVVARPSKIRSNE